MRTAPLSNSSTDIWEFGGLVANSVHSNDQQDNIHEDITIVYGVIGLDTIRLP